MREKPAIIKAINALMSASSDEPIHHIPNISEEMALKLVELGYASQTPWSKDPNVYCYQVTTAGFEALEAKAKPREKLAQRPPRIPTLPPRLK
ncbi:hypothetical protein ACVNHC_17070 [Pannonibacter sp. Q-1]